MYFNDHPPPHFHAEYGGEEILVGIESLSVIAGQMSPRATGMVIEWPSQHQDELRHQWEQARNQQPLGRVDPLR